MTQIDIISGFLGAGKTTLIKKLLNEAFHGQKIVLIENEFGEIGIDGGFLKDAGVEITEMNSGCICCSLVGDFGAALKQVLADYAPDRIIIEPSGVGKLSDVIAAVERIQQEAPALQLHSFVTVVDATKAKIYMKNFGEFFNDQVEHASAILLSRTQNMDQAKLNAAVSLLRNKNSKAAILTTPWEQLTGAQIVSAMEGGRSLAEELMEEIGHSHSGDEEHHHHHHHDEESCSCGHDHHDGESCSCGHDHHDEHEHHEHDHCHDEAACDACCGHHHHHGHDADEVFTSWGRETPRKYSREDLQDALSALAMSEDYGYILRAKGMVPCDDGQTWLHFDLVPEEFQIREGAADYTGRLCVIGSGLDEAGLEKLFQLV
ncbi:MAG: GTP-binding protein [Oscillospiraceae bacterium]|jgi:G3E family GTPase|nr:GTP-binding protein [Oscillospiraceae bacterium]